MPNGAYYDEGVYMYIVLLNYRVNILGSTTTFVIRVIINAYTHSQCCSARDSRCGVM
ncbi:hypothetical protein LGK97_13940 [Clostridium sp. CS001]|uniref:hypothetical protein n=1 Tax=Clostridium sp. CS001 TaxID=2880648 RepID=UPI001CF497B8|nr:hypothetical protein [Clostridium sp. CS001]MCB2290843.1 hypothetical protein [Clostridium sp. CS001]